MCGPLADDWVVVVEVETKKNPLGLHLAGFLWAHVAPRAEM